MREELIELLKGICPNVDFNKEAHLVTEEILDSFDIIRIIAALSEKYTIDIDPDDLSEEILDSVDGMCELVKGKKNE